jgi:hypothetical protein
MSNEQLWDEKHLLEEMERIVNEATAQGVILRGLGAAAIRKHTHGFAQECKILARPLTDLDFITYSKQERRVLDVLKKCGYMQDRARAYMRNLLGRSVLEDPNRRLIVDLFFDKLSYNHILDLRGRLEQDQFTIPLADIVLEKTQIVQINEKDVKDMILLMREHQVGQGDNETINISRICDVLSNDWGFYYTVTTNLDKIAEYAKALNDLKDPDKQDVLAKITQIKTSIESTPKSMGWKMRARVGPKKKWYTDVEELYSGH